MSNKPVELAVISMHLLHSMGAGDHIEKYYEEDFHDNYRTPTD